MIAMVRNVDEDCRFRMALRSRDVATRSTNLELKAGCRLNLSRSLGDVQRWSKLEIECLCGEMIGLPEGLSLHRQPNDESHVVRIPSQKNQVQTTVNLSFTEPSVFDPPLAGDCF